MAKDFGSYNYSSLENEQSEFKRLKDQASLAAEIERKGLERHGLREGMDVLDLGCGPGLTSRMIAGISKTGSVLGVDLNQDLLKLAREEQQRDPANGLEFALGNVYDLSSLGQTFDFVYCRFVFQHLRDPLKALQEISGVLNPGGTVLICDVDDSLLTLYPRHPTYDRIFLLQQKYQERQGGDRFVGRKLASYMAQAGFRDLNVHVETIPSDHLGIENFVELTIGYKLVFLKQNAEDQNYVSEQEVKGLHDDCARGNYFGTVGLFNVSGARRST